MTCWCMHAAKLRLLSDMHYSCIDLQLMPIQLLHNQLSRCRSLLFPGVFVRLDCSLDGWWVAKGGYCGSVGYQSALCRGWMPVHVTMIAVHVGGWIGAMCALSRVWWEAIVLWWFCAQHWIWMMFVIRSGWPTFRSLTCVESHEAHGRNVVCKTLRCIFSKTWRVAFSTKHDLWGLSSVSSII